MLLLLHVRRSAGFDCQILTVLVCILAVLIQIVFKEIVKLVFTFLFKERRKTMHDDTYDAT